MRKTKLKKWDSVKYLKTEADMADYLAACLEEAPDDPAFITHALGVIARAQGMSRLSRATGISRKGLYQALSADGNPEFATVLKVVRAMGLSLTAKTHNTAIVR